MSEDNKYPAGTVAVATVMGVDNVKVFRRYSPETGLHDWAFNPVPELGLKYSCLSDHQGKITNIEVIDTPEITPKRAPYDITTLSARDLEKAIAQIVGESTEENGEDYYEEYTGVNAFYHLLAGTDHYGNIELEVEEKDGGRYLPGLGVFKLIESTEENFNTYEKSWDNFMVFTFNNKYYRIEGNLDSYGGGVWDGMLHEVVPAEKTIRVWNRV